MAVSSLATLRDYFTKMLLQEQDFVQIDFGTKEQYSELISLIHDF